MPAVLIRQAVSPDIERLSAFEHSVKSDRVWQMSQEADPNRISTVFSEVNLPREMKLSYTRSPDGLQDRWKDYSSVLVACINEVPVGYISISTMFSPEMMWIKDLVVDESWRRKGIATSLYYTCRDWGTARDYLRVTLEMSSKNFPGINLARKLGFEYSGFNTNYFNNNDIALFFSCYLA